MRTDRWTKGKTDRQTGGRAGGQAGRHDEANSSCSKFCEPMPNKQEHVIRQISRLTR
jgi:hypothetical protein